MGKAKYLECLEAFRRHIMHDPASALQLFNFINGEDMSYSVRYGDVKNCHQYAIKHQWFQPMRRKKKSKKKKAEIVNVEVSDHETEGGEGGCAVYEMMSDEQFDHVLAQYNVKYHNPPRNASQIMNFAKEIELIFKYKACRIAFNRWKQCRNSVMPKMDEKEEDVVEPGSE